MGRSVLLAVILVYSFYLGRAQELFKNPGVEDSDIVSSWGHAWGYKQERVTDSHSGTYALKVSGRTQTWQGPGQDVLLKPNGRYAVQAYIKLLNNDTKLFQKAAFTASYKFNDGVHKTQYINYAEQSFLKPSDGWFLLRGVFNTMSVPWSSLQLYIQSFDAGIEYLVDDFSLQEIPADANWKTEANNRIEKLRKSNVTVNVTVSPNFDPRHVELQIRHKRHLFAFGSVVDPTSITRSDYKQYQNAFYEFFNWATVGDYKWKYNRGTAHNPNYDLALNATDILRQHGIPVRGHNMFWGVPNNVPTWVKTLDSTALKQAIVERVTYMTNMTRGKLAHWDINNELLHGQYFEEVTRDPVYSHKIYKMVHDADPGPKLFLNEYNVLSEGTLTYKYVEQAQEFKKANVGLYGLGLQSHFPSETAPDPTLLKMNLDTLATTGLPLWITELTLAQSDENVRADWFETALTTYFSHPAVEGVILWGFWDQRMSGDGALLSGNYYHINAAGKRWLDLLKKQWSTNVTRTLTSRHETFNFRGFQGDYDVIVNYMGKPIKVLHFTIPKQNEVVNLTVDGDGHQISIPTSAPINVPIVHNHHVTYDHKSTLGHAASTSHDSNMTCTTRYSSDSAVGDDKHVDIGCHADEVLTGCMGKTKDGSDTRDGDLLVYNGKPVCRSVNAWRSSAPVQAIARCCKRSGLQCSYLSAGPSGDHRDDQIRVDCPNNMYATGCTSYNYYGAMDGAFPSNHSCIAENEAQGGVFTYAACCSAPSMVCTLRTGSPSGVRRGDTSQVTCQSGETLLGCSVYSEDGHTAGADVINKTGTNGPACTAINAKDRFPGEGTVIANAVCCT